MARREGDTVRLDDVVRRMVDDLLAARLRKLAGGEDLGRRLREIERRIAALERKVERLAGGRRPSRRGTGRRPGRPPLHETCLVDGCGAEHYALGLCSRHYQQLRRGRTDLLEVVERAKAAARREASSAGKKASPARKKKTRKTTKKATKARRPSRKKK